MQGGCLRDGLKRNPIGMQWYQNGKMIARSMALGLAALHANHVVGYLHFTETWPICFLQFSNALIGIRKYLLRQLQAQVCF